MRIAVNTRFLLSGKLEGIGIYTQEILKRVITLMPQHQFYFLFDRPYSEAFIFAENVTPIVISPPARHPFLWYWWFEKSVPEILKKISADVFFSPDGFGSLHTETPQILTIHDIGFEHFPKHTPFLVRKYYRHFTPKYCRQAKKILAVSEFTKQDLIQEYAIDAQKIEVVTNGFDAATYSHLSILPSEHQPPYFIFVGAVHPRKNVLGLLKAFEHFKQKYQLEHQLMIVGKKSWMYDDVEKFYRLMQFRHDVIWKEHAERQTLLQYLQCATAMVYPSWFEGFGIPLIEAMSIGVPIVCSNTSALPEVVGDAAILVNPEDTTEIATVMYNVATNKKMRIQLIDKGKLRAHFFDWDKSAQKVAEIILSFGTSL